MTYTRAVAVLRWTWLVALVGLMAITVWQRIYDAADFQRVAGWLGATTGAVVPIALLGRTRGAGELRDAWPFWLAFSLSALHIGLSLAVVAGIARTFSLAPLDQYMPFYGILNPLVLGALAYFFVAGDRVGADGG